MSVSLKAIRGMHDVLPVHAGQWSLLEEAVREIMVIYGYTMLRLPIVEKTELYARTLGEVTDIVEKEMYCFADRNGDSLSLRPEGTAGCVRAAVEHGLCYNQVQRLWYMGPMFRHERPQQGRYRQFHQVGVETFGMAGPDIDAELLLLCVRLWRRLGIDDLSLQLNTLGDADARAAYRQRLVAYFSAHLHVLDEDSQRRLHTNPLRILDSKNPALQEIIHAAPQLLDHVDSASRAHFDTLCAYLDAAQVPYVVNPRLVRGLDYYNRTVFEWVSGRLGAQGTVCAGGRYDGLVAQLGGHPSPAAGLAMGMERLVALLPEAASVAPEPHVYLAAAGEHAQAVALLLAEQWRDAVPGLRLVLNCGGGGFKAQMKRADRSGARLALIVGEDELARGEVTIKPLREDVVQWCLPLTQVAHYLSTVLR